MTNELGAQTTGAVLGFFLPLALALVMQPGWSKPVRTAVSVVISLLLGVLIAWLNHQISQKDIVQTLLAVLLSAQVAYARIWAPSGITPALELATSTDPLTDVTEEAG